MSYSINTIGKGDKAVKQFVTVCNHEGGCKATVVSTVGKGDSWQQARKAGWFSDSAANHRCPIHRPSAMRKAAKAAKVTPKVTPKGDKAAKGSKVGKAAKKAATKKS